MRFKGLVQIEAGKAFDVKTGQPHGTDKHYPERVILVFELLIQLSFFHLCTMGKNVQSPLFEGLDFVLLLADHHSHFGFLHPFQLTGQLLDFLLRSMSDGIFQVGDLLSPVLLHQIVHPDTGDLIQADKHGLAAGPEV